MEHESLQITNTLLAIPKAIEELSKTQASKNALIDAVIRHSEIVNPLYRSSFLSNFLKLINDLTINLDNPIKVQIDVSDETFKAKVCVTDYPLDNDNSIGYVIKKHGLIPISDLASECLSFNLLTILLPELLKAGYKENNLFYLNFEGITKEELV